MKDLTLKQACEKARKKMREDSDFMNQYELVKETIRFIFDEENIDEEFYEVKTEEEVVNFAKSIISSKVDIEKIEIIPNKTVLIRGNAHFNIDEAFMKRNYESHIVNMIGAFTGYTTDISL